MDLDKIFGIVLIGILLCFYACQDECSEITCFNSGVCEDGKCECPLSYTGEFCEIAVENNDTLDNFPVRFLEIELIDFPATKPGGLNWDASICDGVEPDIYLTIQNDSGIVYTSEVLKNCVPNNNYKFRAGIPFISPDAYDTFVFRIYDSDREPNCQGDEFMAAIQRKLYNNLSDLQTRLTISNPQSDIAFRLRMNYP
jgi:hypothetical protein